MRVRVSVRVRVRVGVVRGGKWERSEEEGIVYLMD